MSHHPTAELDNVSVLMRIGGTHAAAFTDNKTLKVHSTAEERSARPDGRPSRGGKEHLLHPHNDQVDLIRFTRA